MNARKLGGAVSDYLRRNALACVALFFALSGGVAWATHPGGVNTISSTDILNEEVRTADLAPLSVTGGKLASNSVGTGKVVNDSLRSEDILDGTIGGDDIVDDGILGEDVNEATLFNDGSLTAVDLAESSVGSQELAGGSVRAGDLGDGIVDRFDPTPTLIDGGAAENGSYNTDQSVAACNAGEELIGGYGTWTDIAGADEELFIQRVGLGHDGENVIVVGGNDSGLDRHLAAVATCLLP